MNNLFIFISLIVFYFSFYFYLTKITCYNRYVLILIVLLHYINITFICSIHLLNIVDKTDIIGREIQFDIPIYTILHIVVYDGRKFIYNIYVTVFLSKHYFIFLLYVHVVATKY